MRDQAIPILEKIIKDEKKGKTKVSLLKAETELLVNERAVNDSGLIEKYHNGVRIITLTLHIRDIK